MLVQGRGGGRGGRVAVSGGIVVSWLGGHTVVRVVVQVPHPGLCLIVRRHLGFGKTSPRARRSIGLFVCHSVTSSIVLRPSSSVLFRIAHMHLHRPEAANVCMCVCVCPLKIWKAIDHMTFITMSLFFFFSTVLPSLILRSFFQTIGSVKRARVCVFVELYAIGRK